ncbi:MAG: hypothetical protein A2X59_13005 [Nitrospirae bacterium GWC2_42_7]|nr:MAG: hypothetical protein A2X59_13005 [Nitrospirae bacterium GWC2_42_7]
MKILIENITDEGLIVDLEENFNLEDVSLSSPVEAHLELQRMGQEIIISGIITTVAEVQCSRCLKDFRNNMDIPMNVVYHPLKDMLVESHELKGDQMDTGFFSGNEIDLQDILKEQILLNVQMKPLCDENCKGLCPVCGTDLNVGKCSCVQKSIDPRLEVLKNLLEKRKE